MSTPLAFTPARLTLLLVLAASLGLSLLLIAGRVVVTGRRVPDAQPAVAQGRSTKPVASASASESRG